MECSITANGKHKKSCVPNLHELLIEKQIKFKIMNIEIDLSDEQILELIEKDHRNDVDFLSSIVDECCSDYWTIVEVVKKLTENLEYYYKEDIIEHLSRGKS